MTKTYCSEVCVSGRDSERPAESGDPSDVRTRLPLSQVKVLLILTEVDGFHLERFTDRGELVSETQHETMDEAMSQAYSEYDAISDWRFCPDGVDALQYMRAKSDT
jgi:hypothetical protein